MTKLSRKQREIHEREILIKETAKEILSKEGFHALSMDKIAKKIEYSKGTIYQHFACKEEIIGALCIDTIAQLIELFKKAADFNGNTRQQILAVLFSYVLNATTHPEIFKNLQLIRDASVQEKLSKQRLSVIISHETKVFNIVVNIVNNAVTQGDLVLPENVKPQDLVFGLWSTAYGGMLLQSTNISWDELGVTDTCTVILKTTQSILDGLNWRPHSSELNIDTLFEKFKTQLFTDEYRAVLSTDCCETKVNNKWKTI